MMAHDSESPPPSEFNLCSVIRLIRYHWPSSPPLLDLYPTVPRSPMMRWVTAVTANAVPTDRLFALQPFIFLFPGAI